MGRGREAEGEGEGEGKAIEWKRNFAVLQEEGRKAKGVCFIQAGQKSKLGMNET